MRGSNILFHVFVKRILAFGGIAAFFFLLLFTIILPQWISAVSGGGAQQESNAESQWPWCGGVVIFCLLNLVFEIWLISDAGNYFFYKRSFIRFLNSLATGFPVGFCLHRIFAIYYLSFSVTPPLICMASSALTFLVLGVDVEWRMVLQLSPIPPKSISLIPSCRGVLSDARNALLSTAIVIITLAYLTATPLSKDLLICGTQISLTVSICKLTLDSLLVNLVMHPIDFEKLKPNILLSGDINSAKSQIFNGNYFYAIQNFNTVFLLNNMMEGLGLDGISYDDLMHSFDNSSTVLNHHMLIAKQRKYIDNLYLDTASRVDDGSTNLVCSLANCFGVPRPAVVSRRAADPAPGGMNSPTSSLFRDPSVAEYLTLQKGVATSLFQVLCRSLALRDLCRVARVSPFRRALIYRNPVLLHQTMYSLCSLIDYHTVQVRRLLHKFLLIP